MPWGGQWKDEGGSVVQRGEEQLSRRTKQQGQWPRGHGEHGKGPLHRYSVCSGKIPWLSIGDPLEGLRVSSHTAWWQDQTLTAQCQPRSVNGAFHGIYRAGGHWASPARLLSHHVGGGSEGQRGERALPDSWGRSPSARSTSCSLLPGPSSAGRVAG